MSRSAMQDAGAEQDTAQHTAAQARLTPDIDIEQISEIVNLTSQVQEATKQGLHGHILICVDAVAHSEPHVYGLTRLRFPSALKHHVRGAHCVEPHHTKLLCSHVGLA